MPLSMARSNDRLCIGDIKANKELKQKLMDMGFTKGSMVHVLQGNSSGTIMVKVRDSKVVLNLTTAHKIQCS